MGYRAYHVTEKTIWRKDNKHLELIDDGCNYATINCFHYISSAYAPSVETTPIGALENLMSELDTGRDFGEGTALLTNERIDEFIKYLKEEYDNGEHDEELKVVIEIMNEIKERENGDEYNQITFF